jgi:hypothetical protein
MADYLAPFKMPEFTTEKYEKKKADYIAKNGYVVTFPQIGDIIHLGLDKPMTEPEKILWYSGKRNEIPERRLMDLYKQKARKKEKYERMLSSPIPNWVSNYTSVLTAWDNVQDVIISLAAIGRIAIKFLPRFAVGWIAWPVSILWLVASVMSTIAAPTMCVLMPMSCKIKMKKDLQRRKKALKARHKPPESGTKAFFEVQKDKLKRGFKGYAKSGGYMPSFSDAIQAAQVTKDIWGVGLSIGPIFGLAYDLMSGGVRWAIGQKVAFKRAPYDIEIYRKAKDMKHEYARWKRPKTKMTKAEFIAWKEEKIASGTWGIRSKQDEDIQKAMRISQHTYGWKHQTHWETEAAIYCATEIAGQGIRNILDHWNPMENVEGLEHIEIEAYNEPNPLIEEILIEEGLDPEAGIAWPQLGKRWATYEEIQTSLAPVAAENFEHFTENCDDEQLKAVMENSTIEFGLHNIAMLEGTRSIEIQYHAAIEIGETLLNHRFSFPLSITEKQIIDFAEWCEACEETNTRPKLREILRYARDALGFEFTTKQVPFGDR